MNSDLPATCTVASLELVNPFVPDDFINACWPQGYAGGRRRDYSAAQLHRVHLLSLLSPVHSVNLLVKMLPEQRAWRKFAGLRRQTQVPGARVPHEIRCRVSVAGLRHINQHLLAPLIARSMNRLRTRTRLLGGRQFRSAAQIARSRDGKTPR
jgi:hypothetical protein